MTELHCSGGSAGTSVLFTFREYSHPFVHPAGVWDGHVTQEALFVAKIFVSIRAFVAKTFVSIRAFVAKTFVSIRVFVAKTFVSIRG